MMNRATHGFVERGLGKLGLLLVALTGWAAKRLEGRSPIGALAARLVLGAIMAVGWAVDRLPGPVNRTEASRARRGNRAHRVQCDHCASV